MSPEAQRIAIAESCGITVYTEPDPKNHPEAWKNGKFSPSAAKQRRKNWPSSAAVSVIPDYLKDLNAMHEVEKTLSHMELVSMRTWLFDVCGDMEIWCATAAQRAEAYLKTIGKWTK